MSKFQVIILGVFVAFIIIGVAVFALYRGGGGSTSLPSITIWGTYPGDAFTKYVATVNNNLAENLSITYVEKRPDTFSRDFIAALARGQGPDAILIPAEMILPHEDKLANIPYTAYPARDYMNTYIDEARIYLNPNGIAALPFSIDPIVMYWNRDSFNSAGVATYPMFWDEFTALNKKLTSKTVNGVIHSSAIAMGDFSNVLHARELFGTLLMQIGNPVTVLGSDGIAVSTIKLSATANPTAAVQFFTQFVNSTNANYSWNRSMPDSKTAFLSGTLATYFGFASELADLRNKNPNLNFDVAPLPQVRTGGTKTTYGQLYGMSIVRSTPNANGVYQVLSTLMQPTYLNTLATSRYLPSVYRSTIGQGSTDPYITIFNNSALVSRTWLDADVTASTALFDGMAQSITSGQKTINQAIQDAGDQYDVLLRQAVP